VSDCDCEPFDLGDGEIIDHDGDCPRNYDHLHTAEQIAVFRRYLMLADAHEERRVMAGDSPFSDHREVTACMQAGVTARAVELGLETP
jgi:hypothetical protein